jgi:short subunit dehydrogenase-like uncharacterized protein
MARDLSVVVFGATGITGRLACAHLAERAAGAEGLGWAAAGRDPEKVARVLGELGVTAPETIAADVADPASLEAMAARAKVVLNMVGPYTLHGEPVIEACIAGGADYMDLTGEIPFVREMIERHGERAAAAGVKVVNTAGFEAMPPDLLVLLAADTARERWSEDLAIADLDADLPIPGGRIRPADVISGGTLQSLAEMLSVEDAALATDSAALILEEEQAQRVRAVSPISIAPRFNAQGDVVTPMSPSPFINPAVIQRTAALLAAEDGRVFNPFRYREGVAVPGGAATMPLRYLAGAALGGTQAAVRGLHRARPAVRRHAASLLRRSLPSGGFGPTGDRMEDWTWRMAVNARTVDGHFLRADLEGEGQPGYLATGRMLGEAGLLLSEDGATPERRGFLTPAAALGTGQLDRFRHAGVKIQVSS